MDTMTKTQKPLALIAAEVAAALGWKVKPDDERPSHWAQINDDQGHGLILNAAREPGKLCIGTTCYPTGPDRADMMRYNAVRPSIKVSRDKSAAQIANDIKRRLMPEYLALWADCQARAQASHDHRNAVQAHAQRLADALGLRVEASRDADQPTLSEWTRSDVANYSVKCHRADCDIDLRTVPYDLAVEILKTVKAAMDKLTRSKLEA